MAFDGDESAAMHRDRKAPSRKTRECRQQPRPRTMRQSLALRLLCSWYYVVVVVVVVGMY